MLPPLSVDLLPWVCPEGAFAVSHLAELRTDGAVHGPRLGQGHIRNKKASGDAVMVSAYTETSVRRLFPEIAPVYRFKVCFGKDGV